MTALSVLLVGAVFTVIYSIDLSVLTIYGYQRYITPVTPRNALAVPEPVLAAIEGQPTFGARLPTHVGVTQIHTVFGKFPFVIFGLDPGDRDTLFERMNLRLLDGRLPEDGAPEAALSHELVRNKKLALGDIVLTPDDEENYAPMPVTLVGVLEGDAWFAISSRSFVKAYFFPSLEHQIVLARSADEQRQLDRAMRKSVSTQFVRLWTYDDLVRETRLALANLYLITTILGSLTISIIAVMAGLLSNIYFTQRMPEFATLAAIGYPRADLIRRVFWETLLTSAFAWAIGALLTFALLTGLKQFVMEPRGLIVNPADPRAYAWTLIVPLVIAGFAMATVLVRLRRLDPVTIIERRA